MQLFSDISRVVHSGSTQGYGRAPQGHSQAVCLVLLEDEPLHQSEIERAREQVIIKDVSIIASLNVSMTPTRF